MDREVQTEQKLRTILDVYLVRRHRLYFPAIKHHRQLSFDLRRLWA